MTCVCSGVAHQSELLHVLDVLPLCSLTDASSSCSLAETLLWSHNFFFIWLFSDKLVFSRSGGTKQASEPPDASDTREQPRHRRLCCRRLAVVFTSIRTPITRWNDKKQIWFLAVNQITLYICCYVDVLKKQFTPQMKIHSSSPPSMKSFSPQNISGASSAVVQICCRIDETDLKRRHV